LKEAEGPKEELKEECEHEWSVIPICKKCGAILYGFANP
jgi:hypothetical protein